MLLHTNAPDSAPIRLSCGAADVSHVDQHVELNGWVNRRRDHGGLIFIDVRDRDGITQAVFNPQHAEVFTTAESLHSEDVVRVRGLVRRRPDGTQNAKLATGEVEIAVVALDVLAHSLTPPFPIAVEADIDEALCLKYRYLDLRRPRLQRNLTIRHRLIKAMRDFFDERDFLEIETPILIKSTPEGARDYLVPSRIHPGMFYALPQSPQLLKQILMIGGLGRYMQIARCFRDEDSRSDRQFEFTQLDVEMSFVNQEEVMAVMEDCMAYVWSRTLGVEIPRPIPRLSYDEAMTRYGCDKPDLRFGLPLIDVAERFEGTEIAFLRRHADDARSRIVALRYPQGAALSRRDFDVLTETAKSLGAGGLVWIALNDAASGVGWKSSIHKLLTDEIVAKLAQDVAAEPGDAILLIADERVAASDAMGKLRLHVGSNLGLRAASTFAFCWVLGFPLFESDPDTGAVLPTHHPFTAPLPGQEHLLETDPLSVHAQHYDLVLNGFELGSGSIRIHDHDFQQRMFKDIFKLSDAEIADRFGFFIEALRYGAPPHGGMALGLDRVVMLACGETTIRDVIAFPKNQMARDLMMDAPSGIREEQLRELHLRSTITPKPLS
ncbi:MAG TPA: aspartate--tRNA ligase [Candidatus Baltobacteraceae bacterium]|nr:aspartate--tRNA ligase [Candidatus Baltobacteraceae bacterium]